MIDILVESQAAAFIKDNRPLLRDSLQEKLNFSWDSVFLLDYIFIKRTLEFKDNPNQVFEFLISLSSYLGICIYKVWEESLGAKPKLQITEKPKATIVIKLDQGSFVADEPISFDLLDNLNKFLQKDEPYARNETLPYGLEKFKINYFAHGVVSGLNPNIKGTWKSLNINELQVVIRAVASEITEHVLIPLQLKNPDKTNYLSEGFYNPHLIFPPLGFNDNLLGLRPAYGIALTAKKNNVAREDLINLGSILIESPSILQAALGFIILACFNARITQDLAQFFHPKCKNDERSCIILAYCTQVLAFLVMGLLFSDAFDG
jgi:hypothetical protein